MSLALLVSAFAGFSLTGIDETAGQDPPAKAAAPKAATAEILTETAVIEEVTASVDRALEYLATQQQTDGRWDGNNAPNALALLAFMGRGHVPGRGPYQDILEKGKKFIIRTQNDAGVFVPQRAAGSGPMYQQGLATLAMAEMYGMDPDPELDEALRKAVDLILKAQSANGGWRYQPNPTDADLSASVMQIVALRAANNAEIPVPEQTIEKAVAYVKSCADPKGGFGYQGPTRKTQTSAAGIVSLQLLGYFDDPTLPKALDYLATLPVEWSNTGGIQYWYYFHYYAIQANYQAGGEYWNNWHPRVRKMLLSRQNKDGSWDVPGGTAETGAVVGTNKVYWTAMSSLILEVYMHYLPAYQR